MKPDDLGDRIASALAASREPLGRAAASRAQLAESHEPPEAVRNASEVITAVLEPVLGLFYDIERSFGFAVDGVGNREIIGRMGSRFRDRPRAISDELATALRLMRRYYRFEPRSYRGEDSVREVGAILDGLPRTVAQLEEEMAGFVGRLGAEGAEVAEAAPPGDPDTAPLVALQQHLWDQPPPPERSSTDIAEELLRATGRGRILAVSAPGGGRLRLEQRDGIVETDGHEALTHSGLVFDPRSAREPVPLGQYLARIRELNGFQPVCRYRGGGGDGTGTRGA